MNIVINGGSLGIGREIALHLAKDLNNHLIVTGRNREALMSVAGGSPNIYPVVTDISVPDEVTGPLANHILEHFKQIDILINMAGSLINEDFMAITESDARLMMETNFFGPATLIRKLKPHMPSGSHIVNISSMGGFQGSMKFRGLSYYSASKAAIACLSECLAVEFREDGISVNCIALGAVGTEMFDKAFPGFKAPVEAGEIAPFISYFALSGHKFMNGKIFPLALGNP